jgi:hypothetical protein
MKNVDREPCGPAQAHRTSASSHGRGLGLALGLAVLWPGPSAWAGWPSQSRVAGEVGAQGRRDADLEALIAELDRGGPVAAAAAVERLVNLGEEAAERAVSEPVEAWLALPLTARRARADLFARAAGEAQLDAALARLVDPDDGVRRRLLDYLSSPRLRAERAEERCRALESAALHDASESVRAQAVRALSRVDASAARAALASVLERGGAAEQTLAARTLVDAGREPESLLELIRRASAGEAPHLGGAALALLVSEGLAPSLARSAGGAETDADRALLAALFRHTDERVAQAARLVVGGFAERCAQAGDAGRAQRALGAAHDCGLDDFDLLFRRARLALQYGPSAAVAGEAGREIARRHAASGDSSSRARRAAGWILQAAGAIASAEPEKAGEPLLAAEALLTALAREGAPARLAEVGGQELEVLVLRALVPLHQLVAEIAAGRDDTHTKVLELAREVDLRTLAIRRALVRRADVSAGERGVSFDDLLFHDLGPSGLFFSTREAAGYSRARWIDIEGAVYRALANVSSGLCPGFQAREVFDARLGDPLADDERRVALESLRTERHKALNDALRRRVQELEREVQERDADPSELIQTLTWQRVAAQRQQEEFDQPPSYLLRLREFSRAGLVYVERLRENGRSASARQLAEQVVRDFEALRGVLDDGQFELTLSRAESALGGVLMDQDEPAAAEQTLTKALERLSALDARLEADGRGGTETMRSAIAGVLVSLAVNANVKLRDAARAVDYFERAYALDQSDFMRVLLACYRARAGRLDEARAILRETPIQPSNFYNAACTHALLGERELALDYLKRDFEELRRSAGARKRQQDWARSDPDLEALRGDPRFEALLRAAEAAEGELQPKEQRK